MLRASLKPSCYGHHWQIHPTDTAVVIKYCRLHSANLSIVVLLCGACDQVDCPAFICEMKRLF